MTKMVLSILLVLSLAISASAAEITAPTVPPLGMERMPEKTDSFADALWELIRNSIGQFQPELKEAVRVSSDILCLALLFSVFPILTERVRRISSIAGTAAIAVAMFQNANAMVRYAAEAVWEICEYGKLLCPVLTTALAAQGGITSSAALYMGTTAFITLLSMIVSRFMIPMVYIFMIFSVSYCAFDNETMKGIADAVKNVLNWLLKTLLIVFTSYMSITGVVSGATDAATLKAAKVTISSVVPVVGGILSDASESVLISMGLMKNAAGIYGIVAVMAVFLGPFLKVGSQYLLLKCSAGICGIFGNKSISALIGDFSTAMGLLLAMVAAGCIFVLISTVCFMKGIG